MKASKPKKKRARRARSPLERLLKKLQSGYRLEIIVNLSRKPMSIKGLAQILKANPDTIARDVRSLRRDSLVRLSTNGARHEYITGKPIQRQSKNAIIEVDCGDNERISFDTAGI